MLRELLAAFDVDTSKANSALRNIDAAISKTSQVLGGLAEAFAGAASVSAIAGFIEHSIEAGSRVNDLSEKLGVSTDALQAFQFAAGLAGVESEGAAQALGFLNKNLGDAIAGNKEAVESFASLGVNLESVKDGTSTALDLIPDMAEKFAGLGSDAERTALAMKTFGKSGAALLPFLKGGREGAKEMLAEFNRLGGGMSRQFVEAADRAGDEIDKLKFAFNGWKTQIAFAILPVVTRTAKRLQGWMVEIRKLTRETNLAKLAWIAMGVGASAGLFKVAAGFTKLLGLVPKGASLWETLLGMGQLGLIIAGVGALILIIEDLYTWLSGGDSVTGELLDGLFGIGASGEAIEAVKKTFGEFRAELAAMKPLVDEFGKLFGEIWTLALPWIKEVAKSVLQFGAFQLTTVLKLIRFVVEELGAGLQLFGQFTDIAGKVAKSVGKEDWAEKLNGVGYALQRTGAGLSEASNPVTIPRAAGERTTHAEINQQNRVEINVNGAGKDAQQIGQAVKAGVFDAYQTDMADAHAGMPRWG